MQDKQLELENKKQLETENIIIGEFIALENREEQLNILCEMDEPNLFLDKMNNKLITTFAEILMRGQIVDVITVYNAMKGEVEIHKIQKLVDSKSSTNLINMHIKLLRHFKYKRETLKKIEDGLKGIKESTHLNEIDTYKDKLIAELNSLAVGDTSEFINLAELKEKISEQLDSKKDIEGYSWGISDLDAWTSGIVTPRLYVLGGLKKGGKSRFVIHTITELYKQDIPIAFLSLEMPAYELTKVLYAAFLEMNDLRLRSSSILKNDERQKFESLKLNQSLLGIECKPGLKIESVLSRIRRYAKLGYKVIFIDYVQRIAHNKNNQAQELEDISIKIADSARTNNISIILLCQLNALAEREVPTPAHLKGSGGIGEAADTILVMDNIYRRTKNEQEKGKIDIYIESRYGDSGRLTLYSELGSCQFSNYGADDIKYQNQPMESIELF